MFSQTGSWGYARGNRVEVACERSVVVVVAANVELLEAAARGLVVDAPGAEVAAPLLVLVVLLLLVVAAAAPQTKLGSV